ncbi:MAG: acyl carrier protein [Acidobacteriota bacterium]
MSRDPALLDTLEPTVIGLIAKHQRLEPDQITMESTFSDLSIDSLDGMELVFKFEEAFDITIPDDVARDLRTVRQIVDALRQAIEAPAAPAAPHTSA